MRELVQILMPLKIFTMTAFIVWIELRTRLKVAALHAETPKSYSTNSRRPRSQLPFSHQNLASDFLRR